jgi:hypothetical protein
MKRTATTLALLAGFGGGCMSTEKKEQVIGFGTVSHGKQVPGVMGPAGEPVMAARGAMPSGASSGVVPAGGMMKGAPAIQQAGLFHHHSSGDCDSCAHIPGAHGSLYGPHFSKHGGGHFGGDFGGGYAGAAYGGHGGYSGGIFPVPGQGAPGAVAAVGALVPGMGGMGGGAGAMAPGRTSIKFTGPAGMKVTWQLPTGDFNPEGAGLTAPKEYNFLQGQVYRLRLTQVLPNHPGKSFYPTLEVAPANPRTLTFLAHSSVPLTFTNEDFDQAVAGNLVVKVIYLPDRENQDFASIAGAEELVSTRLEPGADPVAEAQRRGTILAVIRLGNIDLENRASPAMNAPPPGGPIMLPPGAMPPGGAPKTMPPTGGAPKAPTGSSFPTTLPSFIK